MEMEAIVIIVDRGKGNKVTAVAKKAGAVGATIFYGRGTGHEEAKRLLSFQIESTKEAILILTDAASAEAIVEAVVRDFGLNEPGKGIIFTMPIKRVIGLSGQKTA